MNPSSVGQRDGLDDGFLAIAMLGPIASGIVVGTMRGDTRLAAATWAATGLFWLVLDWIINEEDVAFHAVLALVMVGLAALGAGLGRAARRILRHAPAARYSAAYLQRRRHPV